MTTTIINSRGLHIRPACLFAQAAREFAADITVNGVNGKNSSDLLTLNAQWGDELEIESDDGEAVLALVDLVNRRFGEPE